MEGGGPGSAPHPAAQDILISCWACGTVLLGLWCSAAGPVVRCCWACGAQLLGLWYGVAWRVVLSCLPCGTVLLGVWNSAACLSMHCLLGQGPWLWP